MALLATLSRVRCGLLGLVIVGLLGASATVNALDWLDLRRRGIAAELAAARQATAPEPWIAQYAIDLPNSHSLHGLKVTIARAPGALVAAKPGPSSVFVKFEGPPTLHGAGIVIHGGQIWLRKPGGQAKIASNEGLFADLPGLGLPLAVFVASETQGLFDLRNEGEFGDVAILRALPLYERGPGLQPMKIGMSKQHGALVLGEVTDREGKSLGGVQWLDQVLDHGLVTFGQLRLRPAEHDERSLVLQRVSLRRGAAAGKLIFSEKSFK